MKSVVLLALGLLAGLWIALEATAGDDGRNLPSWATSIIEREFPKAKVLKAHREGDRDEPRYEVKLRREDGREISVDVTEDTGIVDLDEEIHQDQLPERVLRGLRRAFPKSDIRHSERHTDIRVSYSIDIVSDGRKREVTISPRGKILEIEKRD